MKSRTLSMKNEKRSDVMYLKAPGSDLRALAIAMTSRVLLVLLVTQPSSAILNCFAPNMFGMTKSGGFSGPGYPPMPQYLPQIPHFAMQQKEHSNSYQNPTYPQQPAYGYAYPPMMNPMKLLFQPKWKAGLLLNKMREALPMSWKTGSNSYFYRPGLGYGPLAFPYRPGIPFEGNIPFYGSSGALTDHSNAPTFTVTPTSAPIAAYGQQKPQTTTSYSFALPSSSWTIPTRPYNPNFGALYLSTTQPSTSPYSQNPYEATYTRIPSKQQTSAYSSTFAPVTNYYSGGPGTKGEIYSSVRPSTSTTTKNSILFADGGYDFYDGLMYDTPSIYNQSTYGYSYPEWYTGIAEGPSKVAQQLAKHGLRKQYPFFRPASMKLISSPVSHPEVPITSGRLSSSASFTIIDEPRFVGFGTVDVTNNKEARLSCSFNEAIDQANRPIWIKFLGSYDTSQITTNKIVPPFNCVDSQCRTQEVESIKDYRYKFDNGPATSTLIIQDPRLSDYGTYRCSALTKAVLNNPIETVYQSLLANFSRLRTVREMGGAARTRPNGRVSASRPLSSAAGLRSSLSYANLRYSLGDELTRCRP